ncbi:MAG TPA: xanthine dehydrogenase family protein molybdopterin-binding subunit, partial [Gemmatimonadaceae bacterium]|nr:xanthine dehydrogenase family protein molybdopterin-binding subunit [Gemmatimonadaceae bacterium]
MGLIGQPVNRVDGPLKVSGRATYAYEQWAVGQPLYGYIAGATIGKGRITQLDTTRAERAPGVRLVMTYKNAPKQAMPGEKGLSEYDRAFPVLFGADVRHFGEPVALVVATTFEQARAAANLVHADYVGDAGVFDLAENQDKAYAPKNINAGMQTDTAVGDFDSAFAAAEVTLDQRYTTPYEFSMPMEPHACMAAWHGDDVTVFVSSQIVDSARTSIAATLGIDKARVHIVSPFTGGGFGSKLGIHAETILAVLAARELKQPVKVVLTRQQIFQLVGLRPATIQRVRLGAGRDGKLSAIAHEVNMFTCAYAEYAEQTAVTTRSLYAGANRLTRHRLTKLDLQRGEDVRAPGESVGLLAVESAMDELADALQVDPVQLRIVNEPKADPERNVPFSDRHLVECLQEGARRFGWERRRERPASMRDGRWLVGYGVAGGIRMNFQFPMKARVRMGGPDGIAVVEADMTDIGTGTYTIMAQVAAETLGLPLEKVKVELGRSEFPTGSGSGGSFGAGNSTASVYRACLALREKLKDSPSVPEGGVEAEGEVNS